MPWSKRRGSCPASATQCPSSSNCEGSSSRIQASSNVGRRPPPLQGGELRVPPDTAFTPACLNSPTSSRLVQSFTSWLIDIIKKRVQFLRRNRGQPTVSAEAPDIREALRRLLDRRGEYCLDSDLVVRSCTTRTGRVLYVVIALNGAGPALEDEIDPVCRRRSKCGSGVWVLRQTEISQLLSKANDSLASE